MASGKRKKIKNQVPEPDLPEEAQDEIQPSRGRWRNVGRWTMWVLVVLVLLGAGIFFLWGDDINYFVTAKTGVRAYKKGMYAYADQLLTDAVNQGLARYEKETQSSGQEAGKKIWEKYQLTVTASKLGQTYLEEGKVIPLQRLYYKQIVPPMLKMYGEQSPKLVPLYDLMAQSMVVQKDFAKAELFCREIVGILSKAYGPDDARLGVALGHYAQMLQMAGRPKEAEKLIIEARRIAAMQ